MRAREPVLTDEQWEKIKPLIPVRPARPKGGQAPVHDRARFQGIRRILKTGATCRDLPGRCANPSTCWRRLREWCETDVLRGMWRAFLSQLDHEGILEWDEVFVDASFMPGKQGARWLARPRAAKEQSPRWWSMARVFLSEAISRHGRDLAG